MRDLPGELDDLEAARRKAVDVTAQLRARAIQAGAVLALVGGMLAVASAPALAADPAVQISVASRDVQSGATFDLSYTVTNNNDQPGVFVVTLTLNGFTCVSGDCGPQAPIGGHNTSQPFKATLKAPAVAAGQNQTIPVSVGARSAANPNDSAQDNVQFTVHGADKPQSVRQVSGRVKDDNGKAVTGATVGMLDSQNHRFSGTTNDEGRFQFTATDQTPIAPGALSVGATKEGFKPVTVNVQGAVDKTVTVPLTLTAAAASPSATPSATASPTAAADDATPPATADATPPPANQQNTAQNSKGNSTLYLILGALLVAAGIGAIVLLLMRRRNKRDDGDDPDDFGGGGGGGPVPPSQGRYNGLPDTTRVAAPIGAGVNDATRIRQASLADAPTMMQQAIPAEDEFPDPYGAPAVPGGGYAGAGGYGQTPQYGGAYGGGGARVPAQSGGYEAGPPTQFGGQDDGAYGAYAPQAGYGAPAEQRRYDEPTGMYRPGFDDHAGYQQPPRSPDDYGHGYQNGGAPAEPASEYGSWGAPAGGIDSGNGYGPASGQYGGGQPGPGQGGQQPGSEQYGGQYNDGGGGGQYGGGTYGGAGAGAGAGADGQYGGGQYGADQGGYDQAGYDQGEYDQRGGYGHGESYGRGGYDQGDAGQAAPSGPPAQGGGNYGGAYGAPGGEEQPGYYSGEQQGGGRHGGQPLRPAEQPPRPAEQPPRAGGQRRNIDWLDD